MSGGSRNPRARPTAVVSRISVSNKAQVSGSSRSGPTGRRVNADRPLNGTMRLNFSHIANAMSATRTPSKPAAWQCSWSRWPLGLGPPPGSPKMMRCVGRFDIPQFDAEQHEIDNADFCRIGGRVRGMNVDRPALALDAEPIPPDGVEMRASSDNRHIIPRLG